MRCISLSMFTFMNSSCELFFPDFTVAEYYHFVQNNPQWERLRCWPGRTSSVGNQTLADCRSSVLVEFRCADCVFFSCFRLRAFMLKAPKHWLFECYTSRRLCGLVAFTLDFCAVLFASWKLKNSTKTRPIPRELSTECTRVLLCEVEISWLWHHFLNCDQTVKELFFWPSFESFPPPFTLVFLIWES